MHQLILHAGKALWAVELSVILRSRISLLGYSVNAVKDVFPYVLLAQCLHSYG